jgi:hypothetical protein
MSLHTLANHLQSAGRGEDKVLVHMTPGEVKGLQSLAMAHGGSLTINPETGLPEAGFLKSLLPMIAGLGLSFIPGVGPMLAAGIVGGGTAIATGDLKKGIMAGLGAYGGAGLGAGLAAQGAGAATGTMSGLNAANAGQVGLQASPQMFGANVAGMADDAALASYRTFGANASGAGSGVGLNTGFTNQGLRLNAMGAPTAASGLTPSVTNASAYSPNSFNVGQNLSGVGTKVPAATPINTMSVADKQAMVADQIGGFDAAANAAPDVINKLAVAIAPSVAFPDTRAMAPENTQG